MTPQEQLQDLLRELFQLNNADLDFGIYRILNLKHKEVEEFITIHLPKRIEEVREKILARQSVDLRAEIEQLKQQLIANFQVDFNKEGDVETKATQYGQLQLFKEPYNKYIEAKKKLDALRISEDTERAIYNELYRFFDRYYEGGDFISKPRAGANNYMIPYNGEEVKLYWANYDQYYIKTSENFKNYIFTNNSPSPEHRITVEFKIVDAETTTNNKDEKKRLFVPTEKPIEWNADPPSAGKLTVSFYYKEPSAEEKAKWGEKQSVKKEGKGINQRLYAELENAVKKTKDANLLRLWESKRRTSRGEEVPLFLYHLNRYTSINSFDYFIHKDLKGFLRRELDYFLKNEVLSVNFLDPDWKENEVQEAIKLNILKASAIRDLALTIIDFLGELEDFQKRLWEKKKFVVQSDYCLTLDTITDEAVLAEVLSYVLNDKEQKQITEWKKLNFIADKRELKDLQKYLTPTFRSGETGQVREPASAMTLSGLKPTSLSGRSDPTMNGGDSTTQDASITPTLRSEETDTNLKYLLLDTQFLPEDLKWKLLASMDNLDERTNGLLINSENWQALNVLVGKYKNSIKCIYVDPPYNTSENTFVYKNYYKNSSWLAMMLERMRIARDLLSIDGVCEVAIDDTEGHYLRGAMDALMGTNNRLATIAVEVNPAGQNIRPNTPALSHDYCYMYAKDFDNIEMLLRDLTEEEMELYDETDSKGAYLWDNLRRRGGNSRPSDRPGQWFPLFVKDGQVRVPKLEWNGKQRRWIVLEKPKRTEVEIWPIDPKGEKRIWRVNPDGARKGIREGEIAVAEKAGRIEVVKKSYMPEGKKPKTLWKDAKYSATTHGTKLLIDVLGSNLFSYPKSLFLVQDCLRFWTDENAFVLDFFAGSGTTGHAVINLNREDDGNRKYILVEVNKYFDTVTKPRVQKVIFSDKWKDGKPQEGGKGISQIFQYLKLEQYEDTLNNIEFTKDADQLTIVDRLRYLLSYGTAESDCLLNVRKFTNPFGYTMRIVRQNEIVPDQPIDLVTTFNYFLGIDVKRYVIEKHQGREYRIVLGKKRQQEYICDVWFLWNNSGDMRVGDVIG